MWPTPTAATMTTAHRPASPSISVTKRSFLLNSPGSRSTLRAFTGKSRPGT